MHFVIKILASSDLAYQGFLMGQMNANHFDDCKKRTGGAYQRTKSYESDSNHRLDGQHHHHRTSLRIHPLNSSIKISCLNLL